MKLNTMNDLFAHEMKDLYSAEKQIIEALPKMSQAVRQKSLRPPSSSTSPCRKSTSSACRLPCASRRT